MLAAVAAPGCGHSEKSHFASVSKPPTVRIVQPEVRKIVREVGQPSFIEAFERTSIYPKLTAYIDKWIVDIGDKVKKGEVLATLFVPELVEDSSTKKATVKLDEERVQLARKMVEVAEADVKAAEARLVEAKAILAKYQAEVDRWDTEVKRLTNEVDRGVVDPQILNESTNQWKSSVASKDAAKATITKAEAELLSKQATLAKAKVDVSVAQADLAVATSEAKRLEAWVGYLTLTAPFDGVIVARNANTFDFVLAVRGRPIGRRPSTSPVALGWRCADLRRRPHRQSPDLRRHPRAGRQLRPCRHKGQRTGQGLPRRADSGYRHAHLVGPQRQEPHPPCRDRFAQPRRPASSRDVRLRQRDHRALRLARPAGVCPDSQRREDLLLDVQGRRCPADRDPDRRQRRRLDRGHQFRETEGGRHRSPLDADQRLRKGDPGRPVGPR